MSTNLEEKKQAITLKHAKVQSDLRRSILTDINLSGIEVDLRNKAKQQLSVLDAQAKLVAKINLNHHLDTLTQVEIGHLITLRNTKGKTIYALVIKRPPKKPKNAIYVEPLTFIQAQKISFKTKNKKHDLTKKPKTAQTGNLRKDPLQDRIIKILLNIIIIIILILIIQFTFLSDYFIDL